MLPPTFISLKAFGPVLRREFEAMFLNAPPNSPLVSRILELEGLALPSGSAGVLEGDDDAEIDALDVIGFTDITASFDGTELVFDGTLDVLEGYEPTLPLPGLQQLSLVITQLGRVRITVTLDKATLEVTGPSIALRFDRSWVAPAATDDQTAFAEIELAEMGWLTMDTTGAIDWGALPGGQLRFVTHNDPWRIGGSPTTLETGTLSIALENGLVVQLDQATLRFCDDLQSKSADGFALSLSGARIDRNGFTGAASARFEDTHLNDPAAPTRFEGSGAGSLFDLDFGVYSIEVDIQQNVPVRVEVSGGLIMPYFDKAVDCTVAMGADGEYQVALAGAGGGPLVTLTKEQLLSLALTGFSISRVDKVTTFTMSGSIEFLDKPSQLETMPKFTVQDLSVNSKGEVRLTKAWADFNPALTADLIGFTLTLHRMGVAFAENEITVFLTGVVALANGLPQAGVEELSITFPEGGAPRLALKGMSIDATVGGQVQFYGRFAMLDEGDIKGFAGDLALTLVKPGLVIEGSMLAGMDGSKGFSFVYIYVAVELPAGIVVGPNIAIFGFAGLFGYNVAPSYEPGQNWYYDWYRGPPAPGVTQSTKWVPTRDSFAFGAGITFGTADGYTIVARALLVVTSDLLLIEGRAGFLTERTELGEDPALRMLVVFEPGQSVFLAIEAQYEFVENVLFAQGVVEAFFPMNGGDWYVNLGVRDPASKRIIADVLKRLFRADGYVMISAAGTEFGGAIGYGLSRKFSPITVEVAAGILGCGALSHGPVQLTAGMQLGGKLKLKAFGSGLTLSLSSSIDVRVPKPFALRMDFQAEMSLPWPLPDAEVDFTVEWEEAGTPQFPAITTGAATMSNIGTNTLLLVESATLDPAPVVPLDARIAITFAHAIKRPAAGGFTHVLNLPQTNAHEIAKNELTFRYRLKALTLERMDGSAVVESFDLASVDSPIWANWQILEGLDEPDAAPTASTNLPGGSLLLMARTPFAWVKNSWSTNWNGTDAPVAIPTYTPVPVPEANETTLDICTLLAPGDDGWVPSDGETGDGEPDPTLPTNIAAPGGVKVIVHGFPEPSDDGGDDGETSYADPTDQPFAIDVCFPEPVDITDVTLDPNDGEIVITHGGDDGKDVPDPVVDQAPPSTIDEGCRRCRYAIVAAAMVTVLAMAVTLLIGLGTIFSGVPRGSLSYLVAVFVLALVVSLVWLVAWRWCCKCCERVPLLWSWRGPHTRPTPIAARPKMRDPASKVREPRYRRSFPDGARRAVHRAPWVKRISDLAEPDEAVARRMRMRTRSRRAARSMEVAGVGVPKSGDVLRFTGTQLGCGAITYVSTSDRKSRDDAVRTNEERAEAASMYPKLISECFENPAFILTPASTYRIVCDIQKYSDVNDEDSGVDEHHEWTFATQEHAPTSLSSYVYEDVPGTMDVPHFRALPIGVIFSENYIQQMYVTAAAEPIQLVIVDAKGDMQSSHASEWRKSPWHVDREGEAAFVSAVQAIYGDAFSAPEIPGDDVLAAFATYTDGDDGVLAPNQVFDAYVRFNVDAAGVQPLHAMRFRTSRYRDIEHWIEYLSPKVPDFPNPGIPDAVWDTAGRPSDAWDAAEEPHDVSQVELIPLLKEPPPDAPTLRAMRRDDGRRMLILTAPEPLPIKQMSFVLSRLPEANPPAARESTQVLVDVERPGLRALGAFQRPPPINTPVDPLERLRRSTGSAVRAEALDAALEAPTDSVVELRVRWMADGSRAFLTPVDPDEPLNDKNYDLEIRFAHRVPSSSGQCVVDSVVLRLEML